MLLALLLQVTPVQPMPKGTALPPPGTEEGAVMAPIGALLAALERSDAPAMLAVTLPEGAVTAVKAGADGTRGHRTVRWAEFAASLPPGAHIVETLGQPAVEIDGDVAMVWAPYRAMVNGKLSHCGYDHFDLVRVDQRWKILNVTYSQRTEGCAG